VDDHPALAVFELVPSHRRRRAARHIEAAGEVDGDDPGEIVERHGPVVAIEDLFRGPDAGAVDQHVQGAEVFHHLVHRGFHRCRGGHVHGLEQGAPGAQGGNHLGAGGGVEIENRHPRAARRERLHRGPAEPGSAPGNQCHLALQIHDGLL
jgi:hypothetical protein